MNMSRWITVATLVALGLGAAGCKSVREVYADVVLSGETLTYEQYRSVDRNADPIPTAQDVLDRFGEPADVFVRGGKRRRVVYYAFSLYDILKRAEFHFDESETFIKKELW